MVPLEEARRLVLGSLPRLHPRAVPLAEALGCATSVALHAEEAVPPFDNTAVDGYAVRALDVAGAPVELEVVGFLPAGQAPAVPVGPGQTVKIMTGAPMPPGADAVVMVERSEPLGGGARVRLDASALPGENVRRAGDDLRAGDLLFPDGTTLGPAHLGVLASAGYRKVPVSRRPRVGVLSTGDELVEGGGPLAPGQIRDSNRQALLAAVTEAGCEAVDLGLVRDDEAALVEVLQRGVSTCDVLLSSGGVSMGDLDLVKVVLDRLGRMTWMQIAIRPAKPFAFGLLGPEDSPVPVFGLPGNPVSSLVSFELLARPALRRLAGHRELDRPRVLARAVDAMPRKPDGKIHFVRVRAAWAPDGRVEVRPAGGQGSHQLTALAAADALAVVPDGGGVDAGGDVEVLLLR